MAAIAVFLLPAVLGAPEDSRNFFTTFEWTPDQSTRAVRHRRLAFGTVVASIIAMVIAVPVAVGIALFISHYAPRGSPSRSAYVVDLLAAVPSHRLRPLGRAFLVRT